MSLTSTPTRRGKTVIGGFACVLGLVAIVLAPSAPSNAAPLQNHHPVTYNMQGAAANQESKWSTDIPHLLAGHDVVALQEAGPVPPPWNPNNTSFIYQGDYTNGTGLMVRYYTRNFGTTTRPKQRHVYFLHTDSNPNASGRVNLAMVTEVPADDVWFIPPAAPVGRPAFGVRIGETVFFTLHALASGGGDAAGLVESMDQNVRGAGGGYHYAILGDFNRTASELRLPAGARAYTGHGATQQSGGERDYMVTDRDMAIPGQVYDGHIMNGESSDHFPVEFGYHPA